MVEVISGNIQIGVKYTVANIVDETGYITYNSILYYNGDSFVGQLANDTYTTSVTNMKVYADDTPTDVDSVITTAIGTEVERYSDETIIHSIVTAENFNENEEVVYPENTIVSIFATIYTTYIPSQITRTILY